MKETLNITFSVDVAGTANVTPFVLLPNGSQLTFNTICLTNVTAYVFQDNKNKSTFTIPLPQIGTYIIGAQVRGSYCTVQINTKKTILSTLTFNQYLRPSFQDLHSLTLYDDEYSQLFFTWVYPIQ